MEFLPAPNCPQPRFRARDVHSLYSQHFLTHVVDMTYNNSWSLKTFKDELLKNKQRGRIKYAIMTQVPGAYQRPLAILYVPH